jgi:hypothetical protein
MGGPGMGRRKWDIRYIGGGISLVGMIVFVTGRIEIGLGIFLVGLPFLLWGMYSNRRRWEEEKRLEKKKRPEEMEDRFD